MLDEKTLATLEKKVAANVGWYNPKWEALMNLEVRLATNGTHGFGHSYETAQQGSSGLGVVPLADMIDLVGWDQTYDDNYMVYINTLRESKGLPPMVPKHFVGPYAASCWCKQDEAAFLAYCSMVNDPFSELNRELHKLAGTEPPRKPFNPVVVQGGRA